MTDESGSGFGLSDWIQVWIGAAVSISAAFAWLTYRFTKSGFFLSLPRVESTSLSADRPNHVWLTLAGPHADEWDIRTVAIRSPRSTHFLESVGKENSYGETVWEAGPAIGRKQNYCFSTPCIFSSLDEPVKLLIKLSLRALPSVTSRRPITISKRD